MATVATRIARAIRLLGLGRAPTTDDYADGLVALNALLDLWRNDGLLCYAFQDESLTLSASDSSYTIGPGGDLNTTRPVEIVDAWVEDSDDISHSVRLISDEEYAAIPDKTATSTWPDCANYRASMSTGTLRVWPVPTGTVTLKLTTRVVVAAFSATSDTVTLPPGWEQMIDSNLAVAMAPEFPVPVPPETAKMARDSMRLVRRMNAKPFKMHTELVGLVGRRNANILTDQ